MDNVVNLPQKPKGVLKLIVLIIVAAVAVALGFTAFAVVENGTVGVVSTLGAVQELPLYAGFHLKVPLVSKVTPINIQTQKVEVESSAASKDLQVISTTVAVNYHVAPESAAQLYKNVGLRYEHTIIAPAIQESVKAVIARFSAEQLITQRQEVSLAIKDELITKFTSYGLVTDDFNIINLDFSSEFNAAIEAKQTAQQQALKAQQDLQRVTIEAQQKVEEAKADAEAIKARAEAEAYAIELIQNQLLQSREYLEYQKIEKWNGVLPKVQGNSSTIIDMTGLE